jgi:hypothetical protein
MAGQRLYQAAGVSLNTTTITSIQPHALARDRESLWKVLHAELGSLRTDERDADYVNATRSSGHVAIQAEIGRSRHAGQRNDQILRVGERVCKGLLAKSALQETHTQSSTWRSWHKVRLRISQLLKHVMAHVHAAGLPRNADVHSPGSIVCSLR